MTLVLSNDDMERLAIDAPACIDAVERAFADVGAGRAPIAPRRRMYVPAHGDEPRFWMNNIMGMAPSAGLAAVRLDAAFSRIVDEPRGRRRIREGDFCGLVLLFDMRNAELVAILQDHFLSTRRVAATSAVGARRLARGDSTILALIGAGEQARQHVSSLRSVCPIQDVRVFSPNPQRRSAFAREVEAQSGCRVEPVASAREAVDGADIVVTATSSRSPVLNAEWLGQGMHVITVVGSDKEVRGTEIGPDVVRRMDRVVTNLKEQVRVDEQPKLLDAVEQGGFDLDQVADLHELVAGRVPGRRSDEQLTLHDNNTGLGLQFAALGRLIIDRALEDGIGRHLETDMFMTRGGSYAP